VHEVRAVLDQTDAPDIVEAQALHEMARLASLGDAEIASKTIGFEQKAIELADKLAISENVTERRAAKQLLVEAHLSIAEEVARQSFGKKLNGISQWIGRASGIAEEFIAQDGGGIELRLMIAQRALAAMSSFKPTVDPTAWVTEAEDAAEALAAQSTDELWQQRIKWEMGIVYFNALRVEHLRRETSAGLNYGQKAIECLAEGASSRQAVHSSEQLVGQLYFQIGAVHAVHKQDHDEAAEWYDKATPLLTAPRPVSELYSPRREGEVLVSIGVTYWQTGRQSRALELTRSGTELVELAVEDGILAKSSLAVPYGNLATMYQQLGETGNAAKYSELAKALGVRKQASAGRPATQVARGNAGARGQTIQHATARGTSRTQMR
jgi:tetratricopeptide (TPR) repeat protein